MAGLGQGHEAAEQSYQNDGLRDTDVLSSPTLTNFNERALLNGVVPTTINDYHSSNSARNTHQTGNCAVSKSGTSVVVAAGTVLLDGMFYEISSTSINITSSSSASKFLGGAIPTLTGANYERILLVYIDPTISGYIKLAFGSEIETSGGSYPQSPTGHLTNQTVILASCRLTYSSGVVITTVEDKRVFVRPGPLPLSALTNHASNGSFPANDFISGSQAGTLPVANLGFLFARDPAGITNALGSGQLHLFWQSDQGLGENAGGGGAYQLTPTHRTSIKQFTWSPGSAKTITFGTDILYKPLQSQDDTGLYLIDIVAWDASDAVKTEGRLIQGKHNGTNNDFYVNSGGTAITIPTNSGFNSAGADNIQITYIHAGHT
jgi:hypothetical protein